MILGDLSDTKRVEALHPLLGKLSVILKSMIFFPIRLGVSNWTVIELLHQQRLSDITFSIGTGCERYIDVTSMCMSLLMLPEIVGWKPLCDLKEVQQAYSEEKDCAFYSDRPSTYFTVYPGQFLIVFPEDGHAPIIGEGRLRKICAKIKL